MVDHLIPSKLTWRQWIRGKAPDADIDRLTTMVWTYHLKPGPDVEGRQAALKDIEAL